MRVPPQAALLPDGRLHLQHGPIDLVIEAVGRRSAASIRPPRAERHDELQAADEDRTGQSDGVHKAYDAGRRRFATILDELCSELPLLRDRADGRRTPEGAVARRMQAAVLPYAKHGFITPMAAVAGAVAEEILGAMIAATPLRRASVNNGGDIALHLAPGESLRVGLVDRPDQCDPRGRPGLFGTAVLRAEDGIRGVATSGRRGRSFSLGIADAVTILARTAAEADAAATILANAVDLPGHPGVTRIAACQVQADSDLGERLVTRDVAALTWGEIEEALGRGVAMTENLIARGLIEAAALHLQGRTAVAGRRLAGARHAPTSLGGTNPSERGGVRPGEGRSLPEEGPPSSGRLPPVRPLPFGRGEARP